MLRIVVFSIALTLAVAPQAPLLCQLWCHRSEAPVGECRYDAQTSCATAERGDACTGVVRSISTFVREDGPRVAAVSDPGPAVLVPHNRLAPEQGEWRTGDNYERALALERRPLDTNLRL